MTAPGEASFETAIDREIVEVARRDVFRATVLQNARFANRFDPAGRYRTHAVERRLRVAALGLSALGVVLCLLLVAVGWTQQRAIPLRSVLMLFTMAGLLVTFWYVAQLRQGWVDRLDRTLARRAAAQLEPLAQAAPAQLRYTVDAHRLRCDHLTAEGERPRFERPLGESGYALVGDACVVLFRTRRALHPRVLVVLADADPRTHFVDCLRSAGVEIETLDRDRLPEMTVTRAW